MKRLALFSVCLLVVLLLPAAAALAADGSAAAARATAIFALRDASTVKPVLRLDEHTNGISWLTGRWAASTPGRPVESSLRFLETNRLAFGIVSPRDEFSRLGVIADDQLAGWRDVYLQQRVHGIPVLHGRLAFHYDARGRLVAVNGDYVPTPGDIQTPRLTADQAVARALAATATLPTDGGATELSAPVEGEPWTLAEPPSARLVYYLFPMGGLRLAYEVDLNGTGVTEAWTFVVDARSGSVLSSVSDVKTVGYGIDLRGKKVTLQTTKTGGYWKLIDRSQYMRLHRTSNHPYSTFEGCIEIRDAMHLVDAENEGIPKPNYKPVKDPNGDNFFNHGGTNAKKNQRSAVSLARNFATVYKAVRARVGRNSIDGKGLSVVGNVHLGVGYQNAYWVGDYKMMFFGDNKTGGPPYAKSLDAVAHEFGHGITDYSVAGGGLVYQYPSGALSETFSDIWGCTVDYGDWKLGEDLGAPLRDLQNPGAVAQPCPADMWAYYLWVLNLDGGGNHLNCGVGGHFFQRLAAALPAVAPARDGRFTAVKIAYRSYAYLSNYASMREWAFALRQAAIDLYGPGSVQVTKTVAALDELGLSSMDFGQWDDGNCIDSSGNLRGTWVGEAANTMYVGVKFERPSAAAYLYRIYVALQKESLGVNDFKAYVFQVAPGGGISTTYLDWENLSRFDVLPTGQFTPIQITSNAGDPIALDPGSQYFLTICYWMDDTMPVLLLDSGQYPQGRSWVLNQNPVSGAWYTNTLQAAIGDPGNAMIRPMYYFDGGLGSRTANAGKLGGTVEMGDVRVIDGPVPGKSGDLRTD